MNFIIRKLALGVCDKTVPSSKEDFDKLSAATDGLVLALAVEEKFDVLIANFAELERDLLTISLEDMIYREENARLAGRDDRILFNRRLSNLFSSARMYRDQIKVDLSAMDAWKALGMKQWVDDAMSKAASDHVEFRACEALRNTTQHQESPVYALVRQLNRTGLGLCYSTFLIARLSAFSPRRTPNQPLERELWPTFAPDKERKQPERVDDRTVLLMPLVRRYVEVLAEIHVELREKLRNSIESWEGFVQAQIDKAKPVLGDPVHLYAIVEENESGRMHRHCYLPSKHAELRRSVLMRTGGLQKLASRYVTGRLP